MANQADVSRFIIENAERFDLKLLKMLWPNRIGLDVHDVHVEATFDGIHVDGRGSDYNENIAVIKAFVEAAERYVMRVKNWRNSNGLAGHLNRELAALNATHELYERHIFLYHFIDEHPFPEFDVELLSVDTIQTVRKLRKTGTFPRFASVKTADDLHFVIVGLDGRNSDHPYGIIIGTAVSDTLNHAVNRALMEAMRYHFFVADKKLQPLSLSQFNQIESPTLDEHGYLGLNGEYADWFFNRYFKKFLSHKKMALPSPSIEFASIPDLAPLSFARATHPSLIELDFDVRNKSNYPHPFR